MTRNNNNMQSRLSRNAFNYLYKITYDMITSEHSVIKINKIAIIRAVIFYIKVISFLQNFTEQVTNFGLAFAFFLDAEDMR